MTRKDGLPRRVYPKNGAYYYVTPAAKWIRLSAVKDGLAAMFRALAALTETENTSGAMPGVIARWLASKADDWSKKTAADMERIANRMAAAFREFSPRQVTTPVCARYLQQYRANPRTHNVHRSVLRQVLAFAALEGLREGFNPVDNIPQRKVQKRVRVIGAAELDAMARALMTARRGGQAHVRMLGLCLKTGQRVSDVLKLGARNCTDDGIEVDQGKTGAPLLIEWDDELRALVDQCYEGRDRVGAMLVQSTGKPYRYSGVRSAWVRAMAKAGISDLHIHDLRGEAGASLADMLGPYAAQQLLGHASIRMTEDYIKQKTRRRTKAAPMRKLGSSAK